MAYLLSQHEGDEYDYKRKKEKADSCLNWWR